MRINKEKNKCMFVRRKEERTDIKLEGVGVAQMDSFKGRYVTEDAFRSKQVLL